MGGNWKIWNLCQNIHQCQYNVMINAWIMNSHLFRKYELTSSMKRHEKKYLSWPHRYHSSLLFDHHHLWYIPQILLELSEDSLLSSVQSVNNQEKSQPQPGRWCVTRGILSHQQPGDGGVQSGAGGQWEWVKGGVQQEELGVWVSCDLLLGSLRDRRISGVPPLNSGADIHVQIIPRMQWLLQQQQQLQQTVNSWFEIFYLNCSLWWFIL